MKYVDKLAKIFAYLTLLACTAVYFLDTPVWKVFLLKDYSVLDWSVLINSNSKSLGNVYALQGSGLKRKSDEDGFFNSLKIKDVVFNGDVVITDEATKAVIKFNDGSQIEINPQSMIKIEFAKNEGGLLSISKSPKVEVLKGNVADVGLKQLEITKITKTPVKEKRVRDFKTKISYEQIQKLDFSKSRSIAQTSSQIVEKPLPTAEAVDSLPEPTKESVKVTPVASKQLEDVTPPKPIMKTRPSVLKQVEVEKPLIAGLSSLNSNAYNGEDLRSFFVDLSWQPYHQATAYLVKFYQDEKLTNLWFSAKTKENRYRMNQMFNGNLFYVVEAYRGNQQVGTSSAKSLTFNYQAPELKNPKPNTVLSSDDMQYLFTWDKKNFTSEYVLEIAKDPSFASGYKKTVKENFVAVPLLKGTYYWRVFAKNGELLSNSSKINVVTIKK